MPTITGTSGPDTLTGTDDDDIINGPAGTSGDDVIDGRRGHDQLFGGSGNDLLEGGDGDDVLNGGDDGESPALVDDIAIFLGRDTASYASAGTGVTVDLSIMGVPQVTGQGRDTLIGIENLVGGNFDDTLYGNAAANVLLGMRGADRLFGQDGDDILSGGDGEDYLEGGAGADYLIGGWVQTFCEAVTATTRFTSVSTSHSLAMMKYTVKAEMIS